MKRKIVAIHQPNFFPWLGYFEKIVRSDVFIFLDDTQFPKTGGVWANRVKLLINGQAQWMTAPVNRNFSGVKPISGIHFQEGNPWREKMLKSIKLNYSKAPCYEESMHLIKPLILNEETNIAAYNIHAIRTISTCIGLDSTEFLLSSELQHEGYATDLLLSLIRTVQGSDYLCGGGAEGYQDDVAFSKNNINLIYQNFIPKEYRQSTSSSFVPGLSIIDAFMWCGSAQVADMLRAKNG